MKHQTFAPFNGRLLLALISLLALVVACSTEDMVFEPSQEAIETKALKTSNQLSSQLQKLLKIHQSLSNQHLSFKQHLLVMTVL